MKAEFRKYFRDIGIQEPLEERIKAVHEFFSEICQDKIEDVFVNEYVKEDGSREFVSVRFLSKNYSMLAADFISKDDFRFGMVRKIRNFRLQKKDFDLKKATEKSRMTIELMYAEAPRVRSSYRASGVNCDYLMKIFHKYIIPNLKV